MNKEINLRNQLVSCGVSMEAVDKHIKKFIKDVYQKYDTQEADKVLQMNIAKQEVQLVAYVTIVENFKAFSLLSGEAQRRFNISLKNVFQQNLSKKSIAEMDKSLSNVSDRIRMMVEMSGKLENNLVPKLINDYFDEKIRIYNENKNS